MHVISALDTRQANCPQGPFAVPASYLPTKLQVQTHVNGELRQDATTDDLIFSIPTLIKTISEGQTLQPGDVIATGTVGLPFLCSYPSK
jgi:2-keto-4-pentenoate hydratase/2-oxohepta-3-ene-1,7-dioic acid hydratase in catechol pathway